MSAPSPLILLVEDEPEIARIIDGILDAMRFRIEGAGNFADGLVLLNASQPALLIANVLLPGGGYGYALAEAARRLGVPTLLISGHPEVIVEAEARGIPLLAKPFRLSELERAIQALTDREPSATEADHQRRTPASSCNLSTTCPIAQWREVAHNELTYAVKGLPPCAVISGGGGSAFGWRYRVECAVYVRTFSSRKDTRAACVWDAASWIEGLGCPGHIRPLPT